MGRRPAAHPAAGADRHAVAHQPAHDRARGARPGVLRRHPRSSTGWRAGRPSTSRARDRLRLHAATDGRLVVPHLHGDRRRRDPRRGHAPEAPPGGALQPDPAGRAAPAAHLAAVRHRRPSTSRRPATPAPPPSACGRSTSPPAEALRDHLLAEQRRVRAGLPAGQRGEGAQWSEAYRAPTRTPLAPRCRTASCSLAGLTSSGAVTTAVLAVVPAAVFAGLERRRRRRRCWRSSRSRSGITLLIACFGAVGSLLSGWGFDLTASDDDLHVIAGPARPPPAHDAAPPPPARPGDRQPASAARSGS